MRSSYPTLPGRVAEADVAKSVTAAWRTPAVFADPTGLPDTIRLATPETLQEYAEFLLDQEAQYCQE